MDEGNGLEYIKILKKQCLEYEQLDTLFNLSADLLCIAGFDGYFKKINPAVSRLLGYTTEELLSRPINEFVFGDDKNVTSNVRNDIHKGVPLLNFENRYLTKNGEIVWLSWTSMPEVNQKVVFAIAKNITHKKLQEEERNILMTKLTQINEELKQFTRMTSHDIRSPVNNLLSIFGLLNITKIADPETQELVSLLKTTSERLNDTVTNFVDVLIKSDQFNVSVENLYLTPILQKVTSSISSLINNSGTTINYDFSVYDTVYFNKAYMESIFLNMITNAIKYANPEKLPLISIRTEVTDHIHQLIISDNGSGFDMEKVKDKIFGLYQVFHENKESKGIGLHLVHTHISAMGGKISVDSKVNEGTTFTISFKEQVQYSA